MSINRNLVNIFTAMNRMYFLPLAVSKSQTLMIDLFDDGLEIIEACERIDYEHGFLFEHFKSMVDNLDEEIS